MMKRVLLYITLCALLSLGGCANEEYETATIFALDTVIDFRLDKKLPDGTEQLIRDCESVMSRTLPDSDISKINNNTDFIPSEEVYKLLRLSRELSDATGGAFDITCGALASLWDIPHGSEAVPSDEQIAQALSRTGYEKLTVQDGAVSKASADVLLDLGAIAKGSIADKTVEYLRQRGVKSGLVSFGGNIAVIGEKEGGEAWSIGIKDPRNADALAGTLMMRDGYLSVSGDYERYFIKDGVRYHHIFDTSTGYPASSGIISAAVFSQSGALSDALSTAVFVMGADRAYELYNSEMFAFEMIIITESKDIYITDGIKDAFELKSDEYTIKEK